MVQRKWSFRANVVERKVKVPIKDFMTIFRADVRKDFPHDESLSPRKSTYTNL